LRLDFKKNIGVGWDMAKPPLTVVSPSPALAAPPATLGESGRSLWNRVLTEYAISDCGGLEMLAQICHAADRVAALAAVIERDGETIITKNGLKAHPCLRDEIAGRAFIVRALGKLGLSFEPLRPSPGRPPSGGIGWRP
jgi:hypothetical protein